MTYSNVEGGDSLETAFILFQHRLHLFLQKLVHLQKKIIDRDQLKGHFVLSWMVGWMVINVDYHGSRAK